MLLSQVAKHILKILVSNKVPQKAMFSFGVLIMLKKLNFHFYYRIFLKHKKRRVLTFSKKKIELNNVISGKWDLKMSKITKFCLL